ncbi:transcription factor [Gaertneriomyces semiglobifer]|nr:transcription factor [Gaertneriomyces semiglobifer]
MGLPTGFGAKKKDTAAQVNRAIEETRRAVDVLTTATEEEEPAKVKVDESGSTANNGADDSGDDTGPQPAPINSHAEGSLDEDSDDDSDDDEGAEAHEADTLPISHQVGLKDHSRTVSALSVDPAGVRMVTGGRDCLVKLWDFPGMDANMRPFRSFEPAEGNPIRDVQFSTTGDQILVASSSSQMKIYDRDGSEIVEFIKGDPYIRDMRHTKGHVAALTCCRWHPFERGVFLTSSLDSTLRIWDAENKRSQTQVIVAKSRVPGGRTAITSCAYSPDGKLIVGGAADGALRIWNSAGSFLRPTHTVENAHMSGAAISSVSFSIANNLIATRAMDDTLKLWDIRKFTKPINVVSGLMNFFEETNVIFSPNDRYILTGTSVKKNEGAGKICVFERDTLNKVQEIALGNSSVVRVHWHAKLNQIFCGTGDGSVQALYDPLLSFAGVKTSVAKRPKHRAVDEVDLYNDANRPILTPHALPMFKDDEPRSTKRRREKMRNDPVATRRPDIPISGPGRGGKIGTSLTAHIMRGLIKDTTRDEDPREAILRHAKEAEENPYWVAPAYKKNQPQAVYADTVFEDESEEAQSAAKKRRQ